VNICRIPPGLGLAFLGLAALLRAEAPDVVLPEEAVYSPRVANQTPAATFAMSVSALRFEPMVDLQTRNLAESQADVTIRGGIFENTGFKLGGSTLYDPQTGHYFAEIPVAPAMLTVPSILTAVDNAAGALNATVGTVAYGWRPVRTGGAAAIGAGENRLFESELYQGYASDIRFGAQRLAADVAWAHSDSDGAIANGDHAFNRINVRFQLAGAASQTDLFAGYQEKFFGWPNLYTPFNSPESESLETFLVAFNHRLDLGGGDFVQASAYHRRNRDDYRYNRFAALPPSGPLYFHTSWVDDAALELRRTLGGLVLNVRAEALADDLRSTSLTFGPYHTRTLLKLAVVPEKTWTLADASRLVAKAGVTYDDSDRASGSASPLVELARETPAAVVQRVYLSYAQTTQLPTYTALDANPSAGLFRGNASLGRETSRNLELGASAALAGWSVQPAVFYRRDDALVDWTFRRGIVARTANAVDVDTAGLEFVARRSWSAVDLVVGYTWLGKGADYRGATVDASFYALNYARHRVTAAVTARLGRGFELRLDNEARWQEPNFLRDAGGDAAWLTSVGLTYRPPALRRLSLTVAVDNLWDDDFQELPSVPASPRTTSARVGYVW